MSAPADCIAYPELPQVPGALPRADLAKAAYTEFAMWSKPTDYDLLCGAVVLNSKPSVELALSLGAPITRDSSSVLNIISTYYNDTQQQGPNASKRRGGTAQEGCQWLQFFLEHPSCPPQTLVEFGQVIAEDAVRWGNLAVLEYLDHPTRLQRYLRSDVANELLFDAVSLPHAEESLSWLIERGIGDLDARDGDNNRPLLAAAAAAHLDRVRLLLDRGADPLAQNHRGQNILHQCAVAALDRLELGQYVSRVMDLLPAPVVASLATQSDDCGFLPIHELAMAGAGLDWTRLAPAGKMNAFTSAGHVVQEVKGAPDLTELSALGIALLMLNSQASVELLSAGARLDQLSAKGHTGWHLLANSFHTKSDKDVSSRRQLARVLAREGVSIEQANADGLHPLAFAETDKFSHFLARYRRRQLISLGKPRQASECSARPRRPTGM